MNETPIADAIRYGENWLATHIPGHRDTSASPQPEVPMLGQKVHDDVAAAGAAIQRVWRITQQIAANPELDELVEVALAALGQGVAATSFAAATDALRGAIARKAGTVQQVQDTVNAVEQAADGGQPAEAAQPAKIM